MINKTNIKAALTVAVLLCGSVVHAAHPQIERLDEYGITNDTLCLDKEDIYFNAQMENKKFVSLCGYQHTSPDSGYVKYRYGTLDNIELEFPKDNLPPKGRFLSFHHTGTNIDGYSLFFDVGNYRYAMAAVVGNCTLSVYKNLEHISTRSCKKKSSLNVLTGLSARSLNEVISRFPQQFQDF